MKKLSVGCLGVLVLGVALFSMGCSGSSYVAALDLIVSSSEIVIAAIPNMPPADAALADTYLTDVVTIAGDETNCGSTAACIVTGATAFSKLILPTLSPAAAKWVPLIQAVATDILAFTQAYPPATVAAMRNASVSQQKTISIKLTARNVSDLAALHVRAVTAKAALASYRR